MCPISYNFQLILVFLLETINLIFCYHKNILGYMQRIFPQNSSDNAKVHLQQEFLIYWRAIFSKSIKILIEILYFYTSCNSSSTALYMTHLPFDAYTHPHINMYILLHFLMNLVKRGLLRIFFTSIKFRNFLWKRRVSIWNLLSFWCWDFKMSMLLNTQLTLSFKIKRCLKVRRILDHIIMYHRIIFCYEFVICLFCYEKYIKPIPDD